MSHAGGGKGERRVYKVIHVRENEGAFTNEQTRDTGSIGQAKHRTKTNKTQK